MRDIYICVASCVYVVVRCCVMMSGLCVLFLFGMSVSVQCVICLCGVFAIDCVEVYGLLFVICLV